jgi:lipopolysaccharide transport system ATP-binding protein
MNNGIIRAEHLGKKYTIRHEMQIAREYATFRDVISQRAKGIAQRVARLFALRSAPCALRGREDFWALRDVSFEVHQGDRVGIIGRNGAGKTTLLRLLSRITEPSTGRIMLKGRVASLLEVGTGFHPELTGRENIYLNGAILGMHKAEIKSKFDEIVDFSEIEKFLDTPVKRYSSGMYVRLAFAVAAHLEPEILLVDEVLAVGDVSFQRKCVGKMEDVSRGQGRTLLVVSHQMPMIQQLCDYCVLLDSGRMVKMGATREVVADYMSASLTTGRPTSLTFTDEDARSVKGAPYFRLRRMALTDAEGEPVGPIIDASCSEIYFLLEGFVEKESEILNVGFMLFDEMNTSLMMSFHTDQPPERWPQMKPGPVTLRARLDVSGLNQGGYRLDLVAALHCDRMLYTTEDGISVHFEVVGNRGNSPYWVKRRPTVLAPFVPWERI